MLLLLIFASGCHHPTPNTVTVLIESSPNTLDPRIATDAQGARISALIFDSLLRKDEHFNLQPSLALSWEQPDPITLIFHLRSGVRFHNGQSFTSADVAWTLNSMRDGTIISAKSNTLSAITNISTPDPLTAVLHLKTPDANLLWNLSDNLNGIVPNGAGRDLTTHPIGTGPYRFVSQADDKDVILERNTTYWDTPPSIPHVVFAVVPDETTRALELEKESALEKGSAIIAINSLTADTVNALERDPNLVVDVTPGTILNYININVSKPPLHDRRVRQAIALSIDRPAIIHALFRDRARLANSLLPPGHWAHLDENSADTARSSHNIARAIHLLDEAGYHPDANGVRIHITLKTSTDETTRLLAAILQQQLRASGIDLSIRSYEFATFFGDITHGAFELYALRWIDSNDDPDIFRATLASASFPPHGANRGHYFNPAVDQLLAHAASTTDQTARRADYLRIQQIAAEDVPEINLWYLDNVLVHTRRVTNLQTTPSGGYEFLRAATLQK